LKVGTSGPTLLEGFRLREKITHLDHERIPGRGQDLDQGSGDGSGLHRARDRAELVMNSAVAPAV
jgi:catalase